MYNYNVSLEIHVSYIDFSLSREQIKSMLINNAQRLINSGSLIDDLDAESYHTVLNVEFIPNGNKLIAVLSLNTQIQSTNSEEDIKVVIKSFGETMAQNNLLAEQSNMYDEYHAVVEVTLKK